MTEKTRGLILALFQQVKDGKMTPEQGANTVVRAIEAHNRCLQNTQDTLMRHLQGLIKA